MYIYYNNFFIIQISLEFLLIQSHDPYETILEGIQRTFTS